MRLSFYKAMSRDAWFSASAGNIFKTGVLLWLRHPPAKGFLLCVPASDGSTPLEIPACRHNMKFFSKPTDLKDVDEQNLPKCLVPVHQIFPTLEAIVLTNLFVITIQMTAAPK
jgi:hypothetical protein